MLARVFLGAHPWILASMRPAHAKPNVVARRLAGWRPGYGAHASLAGELGLSKQTGLLSRQLQQAAPASHSQGLRLYQRPQTYPQVRAAGPPRPRFSLQFQFSICALSPLLCRAALYSLCWPSVIPSAFCQRYPRCCGTSSLLLFRLRNPFRLMHACARPL
ncbi:hypothetical protein BDW02DRAFT_18557 [Decorospora gaudefroyi]|uniref:Uncharacterized protein n=1 Tax=Decorospora gaudefroyi TaxID=184978 RepID=A0A6A5KAT4_9PLEO|nr:hypothetical protein BDW02DRAFT_18557 [Decorospora gaudefroyi]